VRLLKRCNLLSWCAVGEESPAYDGEKTNDRWIGLEIADEQITAELAGIFREWLRMAFQFTFLVFAQVSCCQGSAMCCLVAQPGGLKPYPRRQSAINVAVPQ